MLGPTFYEFCSSFELVELKSNPYTKGHKFTFLEEQVVKGITRGRLGTTAK